MINALQGTRMGRKVEDPREVIREILEDSEREKRLAFELSLPSRPPSQLVVRQADFDWVLDGLHFRGEQHIYSINSHLLGGLFGYKSEEWESIASGSEKAKEFVPASGDLLFAILDQLSTVIDQGYRCPYFSIAEQISNFITNKFLNAARNNQTIGLYSQISASTSPSVIHDPGLETVYIVPGIVSGDNDRLKSIVGSGEFCRTVFGTTNVRRVAYLFGNPSIRRIKPWEKLDSPQFIGLKPYVRSARKDLSHYLDAPIGKDVSWNAFGVRREYTYQSRGGR